MEVQPFLWSVCVFVFFTGGVVCVNRADEEESGERSNRLDIPYAPRHSNMLWYFPWLWKNAVKHYVPNVGTISGRRVKFNEIFAEPTSPKEAGDRSSLEPRIKVPTANSYKIRDTSSSSTETKYSGVASLFAAAQTPFPSSPNPYPPQNPPYYQSSLQQSSSNPYPPQNPSYSQGNGQAGILSSSFNRIINDPQTSSNQVSLSQGSSYPSIPGPLQNSYASVPVQPQTSYSSVQSHSSGGGQRRGRVFFPLEARGGVESPAASGGEVIVNQNRDKLQQPIHLPSADFKVPPTSFQNSASYQQSSAEVTYAGKSEVKPDYSVSFPISASKSSEESSKYQIQTPSYGSQVQPSSYSALNVQQPRQPPSYQPSLPPSAQLPSPVNPSYQSGFKPMFRPSDPDDDKPSLFSVLPDGYQMSSLLSQLTGALEASGNSEAENSANSLSFGYGSSGRDPWQELNYQLNQDERIVGKDALTGPEAGTFFDPSLLNFLLENSATDGAYDSQNAASLNPSDKGYGDDQTVRVVTPYELQQVLQNAGSSSVNSDNSEYVTYTDNGGTVSVHVHVNLPKGAPLPTGAILSPTYEEAAPQYLKPVLTYDYPDGRQQTFSIKEAREQEAQGDGNGRPTIVIEVPNGSVRDGKDLGESDSSQEGDEMLKTLLKHIGSTGARPRPSKEQNGNTTKEDEAALNKKNRPTPGKDGSVYKGTRTQKDKTNKYDFNEYSHEGAKVVTSSKKDGGIPLHKAVQQAVFADSKQSKSYPERRPVPAQLSNLQDDFRIKSESLEDVTGFGFKENFNPKVDLRSQNSGSQQDTFQKSLIQQNNYQNLRTDLRKPARVQQNLPYNPKPEDHRNDYDLPRDPQVPVSGTAIKSGALNSELEASLGKGNSHLRVYSKFGGREVAYAVSGDGRSPASSSQNVFESQPTNEVSTRYNAPPSTTLSSSASTEDNSWNFGQVGSEEIPSPRRIPEYLFQSRRTASARTESADATSVTTFRPFVESTTFDPSHVPLGRVPLEASASSRDNSYYPTFEQTSPNHPDGALPPLPRSPLMERPDTQPVSTSENASKPALQGLDRIRTRPFFVPTRRGPTTETSSTSNKSHQNKFTVSFTTTTPWPTRDVQQIPSVAQNERQEEQDRPASNIQTASDNPRGNLFSTDSRRSRFTHSGRQPRLLKDLERDETSRGEGETTPLSTSNTLTTSALPGIYNGRPDVKKTAFVPKFRPRQEFQSTSSTEQPSLPAAPSRPAIHPLENEDGSNQRANVEHRRQGGSEERWSTSASDSTESPRHPPAELPLDLTPIHQTEDEEFLIDPGYEQFSPWVDFDTGLPKQGSKAFEDLFSATYPPEANPADQEVHQAPGQGLAGQASQAGQVPNSSDTLRPSSAT